jgi:hypothetical protein
MLHMRWLKLWVGRGLLAIECTNKSLFNKNLFGIQEFLKEYKNKNY